MSSMVWMYRLTLCYTNFVMSFIETEDHIGNLQQPVPKLQHEIAEMSVLVSK